MAIMKSIEVGDHAPDFTATASNGEQVSLSTFQGKQAVVLFFYPKDNTPVCTEEACSFRDSYQEFLKLGAAVIAVSSDSDESHRTFATENNLPYLMIADPDQKLRSLYGVRNVMFVVPNRVTFVIDPQGIVRSKTSALFSGTKHVTEALETLRSLPNSNSQ